jgi:hypothetical protein
MVLLREVRACRQTSLTQRASVANSAGRVVLVIARACTARITDTATGHIATTPLMAIAPTTDTIARMGMALSTATAAIIATGSKRADPSSCRSALHESRFSRLPCSRCRTPCGQRIPGHTDASHPLGLVRAGIERPRCAAQQRALWRLLHRNRRLSPTSARGQLREWGRPAERVRKTPNS